ncbi:MAG: GNAT family N-acetyltransferase [Hyphomicrobiaceae bacterium]
MSRPPGDSVVIASERPDRPDVRALIEALDALQLGLYPAESSHLVEIDSLLDPAVIFLVARRDGVALGCAAMLTCDGYGEIKRMFVSPDARGLGLGRKLVTALEDTARDNKLPVLRLETGIHQPEAIGLYEKAGYVRRGPYGDYPDDPLSVFMEKGLV